MTPVLAPAPSAGALRGSEPRVGMVYIPPGALVTGSPVTSYPRRPDRELTGEQVMLKGFFIDRFAYPNEEGAIPQTNVSQAEATALCSKKGKRLCTELEWERACKGPDNHLYPWGDRYRADTCELGGAMQPRPSGMRVGCQSDFGVFDLSGLVFEWTASPWRRGAKSDGFVVKGGSGVDGELIGRCANAESAQGRQRSGQIGFRCCYGPPNQAEVVIAGQTREAVERVDVVNRVQFARITGPSASDEHGVLEPGTWKPERAYLWRPVSNEELLLFVICRIVSRSLHCGVLVARDPPGNPTRLAFADTGAIASQLHRDSRSDVLWLIGFDAQGRFKRKLSYLAGRVVSSSKERNIGKAPKTHAP